MEGGYLGEGLIWFPVDDDDDDGFEEIKVMAMLVV